jgi:N-acetyl-gamma-glutamylphosphate reductase
LVSVLNLEIGRTGATGEYPQTPSFTAPRETNVVPGFIGGDALFALYEAHPDYEYTLLVRNEKRGEAVAKQYPKARLVYGDLSASEVIEPAAAAADVVVRMCASLVSATTLVR